ncbi:MAG TPA: dihydroneopterin aldolase [Actinomycetota bacterium]|nr:dihydroneopterin aldolase [Actinomycetota bacterium]
MNSRLFLTGIRASGRHGANPGEKDRPQDFVVDLDVEVSVDGDALDETADYRRIVESVREVVAGESFDLVETLAEAVAASVAHVDRVVGVRVVVHKPAAAASLGIQGVSAAATAGT